MTRSDSPPHLQNRLLHIQGLRGLAVLSVVIYHSELSLPGGFIGVDIFFVISGYVITNSIIKQVEAAEAFSLRAFYIKRLRRLLPGFLLVLIPTILLALLFFDPYTEFPEIRGATLSGLLFSANLFFASVDSYDDLGENPLRHLWSLGVEEHFYLVYPLIFLFILRRNGSDAGIRNLRLQRYLFVLFVLSLTSSLCTRYLMTPVLQILGFENLTQYATERGRRLGFFFTPLRAWEILLGCLIATLRANQVRAQRRTATYLSLIGAALLMAPLWFFQSSDSFPGISAVAPVASTGILILYSPGTFVGRILSSRILIFLGDISYSLYLWHWPLMVLGRRVFEELWINALFAVPVSLILAVVSTRNFEDRFRNSLWHLKLIIPMLVAVLTIIGMAHIVQISPKFRQAFPRTESKTDNFAARNGCSTSPVAWEEFCVFGDSTSNVSIYLLGDSNARSASDGLAKLSDERRWKLVIGVLSACPVNFSETQTSSICGDVNAQRLALLRSNPPSVVVVVNHWTNYAEFLPYGSVDQQSDSLETTIRVLQDLRIPTLIQEQIPICEFRNQLLNFRFFEGLLRSESSCLARQKDEEMRTAIKVRVQAMTHLCDRAPCKTVDLGPTLCDKDCRPFKGGINIFSDKSHISPSASKLVAPVFETAIEELLAVDMMMTHPRTSLKRTSVWTIVPSNQ